MMKLKSLYTWVAMGILMGSALLLNTACTDRLDDTPLLPVSTEETIPVHFTFGIAGEQDGYDQGDARQSRSANENADNDGFNARVVPSVQTRADAMPDKIYKLYVLQFDQNGKWLNGNKIADEVTLGTSMTMSLNSSQTDCQLLFIALGSTSGVTLNLKQDLSSYQELCADIANCNITDFATDGSAVDKHPYVLHLPHVKVTSSGIESPAIDGNGTGHDVRILLKRLAAKLTLNWTFNVSGYELKEVRMSQVSGTIPNNNPNHATGRFYFYPTRNNDEYNTYPTAEKEYVDYFRLKDDELSGKKAADGNYTYAAWVPASVRGTSSKVTAPQHRNKDNAPEGACYVDFVAEKTNTDTNEVEDRLTYRIYLGGAAVNDFNIKENTNYTWSVTINSANTADPRIIQESMTPVESKNQQNTSNCFMVIPGTDFWFNPYKHEAGTNGWNDELVSTPSSSPTIKTTITSVEVLWQSRDNGTGGELVLGRYISETNHTNLINYEELSDINKAKVYVKVPVSKGGNAVIAAYNGTTILWSWHLWITDYVPARISSYSDYEPAQERTQNGTVQKYRSPIWKSDGAYANMVMMDRDLGAKKGGFPGIGKTSETDYTKMDGVDRQGLLYEWGRKDPFFGSADGSTNEVNVIYDGDGTPLSIKRIKVDDNEIKNNTNNKLYAIQHPLTFIYSGGSYNNDWWNKTTGDEATADGGAHNWNAGGAAAPGKKTIYDPSPEGWKVPMNGAEPKPQDLLSDGSGIFAQLGVYTGNVTFDNISIKLLDGASFTHSKYYLYNNDKLVDETTTGITSNPKGGRLFFLNDDIKDNRNLWTINNTLWMPVAAERYYEDGILKYPANGHLWTADVKDASNYCCFFAIVPLYIDLGYVNRRSYGWSVRCIQDNGNP